MGVINLKRLKAIFLSQCGEIGEFCGKIMNSRKDVEIGGCKC